MLTIQQYCKAKSLDEAYELLQKNRMNQIRWNAVAAYAGTYDSGRH